MVRAPGGWLIRVLRGRFFIPISTALTAALLTVSGVQLVQLYQAGVADSWWQPQHAVTFSGPGLSGDQSQIKAIILGAVTQPDAYVLAPGARLQDLVTAAGGLLANADARQLDLQAQVVASEQVYVPFTGKQLITNENTLVAINTASADQLRTALGISSVTAQHIVDYRTTNGPFTAISQLLLVPLSRTTFDRIKYLVTI
jgi:competence protein ComEA